jgi:type IV pilus biogenesis protein PilP
MSVRNKQSASLASPIKTLLACALALSLAPAMAQPASGPDGAAGPSAPHAVSAAAPAPAPSAPHAAVPLPSSPMSAATAAEIQRINEQMTLLQAQLNQLELKAKIASKQKEIAGAAPALQSSFDSKSGNPSVVSVAGLKGNLEAVLVFPGGVTQRVKAGDVIDDRRVAKVAINEVVLTDLKGKNVQRLAFGSAPMTREHTPLPGTNGVQPAMLSLPGGGAPLPR